MATQAPLARSGARPELADRIRLPFVFDPVPLAAELDGIEWTPHFVRQNYAGEWSAAALRATAGATHPVMQIYSDPTATDHADTPLRAALPRIAAVLDAFACPLLSVRLMRLGPGSVIHEHSDLDLDAAHGRARLHVPIRTGPGVEFLLNRRPVPMAAGEVWYLRLSDPHSVVNRGACERVHLVIDVAVDAWLVDQLAAGAPG